VVNREDGAGHRSLLPVLCLLVSSVTTGGGKSAVLLQLPEADSERQPLSEP
jgi:hypothetical protein